MLESPFFVGVGKVYLRLRHSTTAKEKRRITDPILQKLRNRGFSACLSGKPEELKTGCVCFSYSAPTVAQIETIFNEALQFFLGDFEIVAKHREILNFTDVEIDFKKLSPELEYKYDEED